MADVTLREQSRSTRPKFISFASAFAHPSLNIDTTLGPFERRLLSIVFVMFYVTYASLGRDVFYNHLNQTKGSSLEDPIGVVLPYVRVALSFLTFGYLTLRLGLAWVLPRIPIQFAPFVFLALFSFIWASDAKDALRESSALLGIWIALPPLAHRLGLVRVARLSLLLIAWVMIISFLLAIFVPSVGIHTGTEVVQSGHAGRWRGIFAHKNGMGPWAAFGSVLLLSYAGLFDGFKPIIRIGWVCSLACLIFSHSSTALVVAVTLLAASAILHIGRRTSAAVAGILTLLLVLAAALFIVFGSDIIFELLDRDATLTGRTTLWDAGIDFFLRRPWLGDGYQAQGGQLFRDYTYIVMGQELGPENGYLALLLDLGIVGFVFFMVPLIAGLRNALRWIPYLSQRERDALEALFLLLAGAAIQSLVDGTAMICTGFDGVITFTSFFLFISMAKSPDAVARSQQRLARNWARPGRNRQMPSKENPGQAVATLADSLKGSKP